MEIEVDTKDIGPILVVGAFVVLFFGWLYCNITGCLEVEDGGTNSSMSYEDQQYAIKYNGRKMVKDACRDPSSFQLIEERIEGGMYYCHYRAKNGFGGYSEDIVAIPID
jgi:hypothetical protein